MLYQRTLPRYYVIRDHAPVALSQLFRDSHTMFKLRIQHLGNPSIHTSPSESETLRIMLEALIKAKQQLQSE